MNIITCSHCLPALHLRAPLVRANRVLAWGLLASPAAQLLMGTHFWRGLAFDLALLAAHGLLSLALFGLPRAPRGQGWMLLVGADPSGLTPRGRFLMTGWSMAVPFLYLPVAAFVPVAGLAAVPLMLLTGWLALLRALQHVYLAVGYALRRWRLADELAALPFVLASVFALTHFFNLLR